jgi:hypothetical protein
LANFLKKKGENSTGFSFNNKKFTKWHKLATQKKKLCTHPANAEFWVCGKTQEYWCFLLYGGIAYLVFST